MQFAFLYLFLISCSALEIRSRPHGRLVVILTQGTQEPHREQAPGGLCEHQKQKRAHRLPSPSFLLVVSSSGLRLEELNTPHLAGRETHCGVGTF